MDVRIVFRGFGDRSEERICIHDKKKIMDILHELGIPVSPVIVVKDGKVIPEDMEVEEGSYTVISVVSGG